MTRVLVTGAGSFTARHLIPLLAAPGVRVIASDLTAIDCLEATVEPLDLTDAAAVRRGVREARPDRVYHLAGIAAPDAARCFAVNLDGTRHLLEACISMATPPDLLLISSAAVYGLTRPEETPVHERTPLRPVTAYGASKAAAEMAALSMHRLGRLRVKVARPFNLVGPGLRPGFAPSDFMEQALAIRGGRTPAEIRVGNLEPRRDFVDVRDAARAYRALLESEAGWGEAFNVATGVPVAVRDLLAGVLKAAGTQARVIEDDLKRRAVDVPEQVGDAGALRALTGWSPEVALETSLRDMAEAS